MVQIEEYSKSSVTIDEYLLEIADEMECIVFDRDLEGKAILIMADSEEELGRRQSALIEKFEAVFKDYSHVRFCGGVGKAVNRL